MTGACWATFHALEVETEVGTEEDLHDIQDHAEQDHFAQLVFLFKGCERGRLSHVG